jgi:hypothetical protein
MKYLILISRSPRSRAARAAARTPDAADGGVEVRPVLELDELSR